MRITAESESNAMSSASGMARRTSADPRQARAICVAVAAEIGKAYGIPAFCLFAPSRASGAVSFARQIAMYVAHVELGLAMQRVADAFGRDRSTVAHACRRIEDARDDPVLDKRISDVAAALHRVFEAHNWASRGKIAGRAAVPRRVL